MKIKILFFLAILVSIFLSCAPATKLTTVWKDPEYSFQPKYIIVAGISKNDTVKKFFEDECVLELQKRGVRAEPSYLYLAVEDTAIELRKAKIEAQKCDAVLVVKVTDRKTVEIIQQGNTTTRKVPRIECNDLGECFLTGYEFERTPADTIVNNYVMVESRLFDEIGHKLVWRAESETLIGSNRESNIKDFVKTMLDDLTKKGIVRKPSK